MRILITGATGFVGGHLAEALLNGRDEIHGLDRTGAWPAQLRHLAPEVTLHSADLTERSQVESLLRSIAPQRVYHLAGYAAAGQSFREPDAAWAGNLTASRVLYDSIAASGLSPRIFAVSSGLIYAPPEPADRPVDESAPLAPVNPYAASKAAADLLACQVAHHPGLDVVRVRPFNQIGPRQSPQFAIGSFVQQLARAERGLAPPVIETGDLSARRDFTDVRDMVDAFRRLMEHGERGEVYNAGSGVAVSVERVLELLRSECRVAVEIVTRADRLRPADAAVLVADATKLRRATGWAPRFDLEQTLRDTLAAARLQADPGAGGPE